LAVVNTSVPLENDGDVLQVQLVAVLLAEVVELAGHAVHVPLSRYCCAWHVGTKLKVPAVVCTVSRPDAVPLTRCPYHVWFATLTASAGVLVLVVDNGTEPDEPKRSVRQTPSCGVANSKMTKKNINDARFITAPLKNCI